MIVEISSFEDARLDVYARLTDVQLRSRIEPEQGVFIAESIKVIQRAFDAGMQPLSFLVQKTRLDALEPLLPRIDAATPVFVTSDSELEKLTGFNLTRGVLAAFRRPPLRSVEETLEGARRVAVLENITNHTNVGAIFRSAAALGIDAVLVSPACYDPWYRRAVRVSMGAVFQIPWTRIGEGQQEGKAWPEAGLAQLHNLGFTTAALALCDDSLSLADPQVRALDKVALIFGTEGDGLARTTIARCDMTLRIPMHHDIDSLNVAAASAVAFWELCR
ncbi:MAG: RNA methyltransferase [Raoultibacter sp.]